MLKKKKKVGADAAKGEEIAAWMDATAAATPKAASVKAAGGATPKPKKLANGTAVKAKGTAKVKATEAAAAPKKRKTPEEATPTGAKKPKQAEKKAKPLPPPPSSDEDEDDSSSSDSSTDEHDLVQATAAAVPAKKRKADEGNLTVAAADALADDDREGDQLALGNFRLSDATLAALNKRGVKALFPIQAATFDVLNSGKDLIGRARTGMGKTLAFALPIIERTYTLRASTGQANKYGRFPVALVMAPTRELAQQVAVEFESVAPSLSIVCVYGGVPLGPSCNALRAGVDVCLCWRLEPPATDLHRRLGPLPACLRGRHPPCLLSARPWVRLCRVRLRRS